MKDQPADSPRQRSRALPFLATATLLIALIAAVGSKQGTGSLHRVPAWTISAVRLKLALDADPSAGAYYDRTASAPLPLATMVKELRAAWPAESVAVVHGAALDVGTALLHRSDIEVGELVGGTFSPLPDPSWHTNEQMISTVRNSPGFFENERVYVFRRK